MQVAFGTGCARPPSYLLGIERTGLSQPEGKTSTMSVTTVHTNVEPTTQAAETRPTIRGMNVQRRAAAAARIFDVVATVVLVFGGLLILAQVVGGIGFLVASTGSESITSSPALIVAGMIGSVVVTAIATVINWAAITLATAVAGYVAQRSVEA